MGEGQEEVVTELKLELLGEVSAVCSMGITTLGCIQSFEVNFVDQQISISWVYHYL